MKKNLLKLTGLVSLVGGVALATCSHYSDIDGVMADSSATAQSEARNQYLTNRFPQFSAEIDRLSIDLENPTRVWKTGKNEFHSLHQMGMCSNLPDGWAKSLSRSFGKSNIWGLVQPASADNPISIHVKSHPEYVHIFMREYNDSHFADKPWYRLGTPPTDVKSEYVLAVNCLSYSRENRSP